MSTNAEGPAEGGDKNGTMNDGQEESSSSSRLTAEAIASSIHSPEATSSPVDAPPSPPSPSGPSDDGSDKKKLASKDCGDSNQSEGAAAGSDDTKATPPPVWKKKDPFALFLGAPASAGRRPARQQQEPEERPHPPRRYSRSASPPRERNRFRGVSPPRGNHKPAPRRPWYSDHTGERGDTISGGGDTGGGDPAREKLGLPQGLRNLTKLPNPLVGVRRWASQDDSVVGTSTMADAEPTTTTTSSNNSNPVLALRRRIASATAASRTPPRDRILRRRQQKHEPQQQDDGGGSKLRRGGPTTTSDSKRVSFASQEENDPARTGDEPSKLSHVSEADTDDDSSSHWLTPRRRPELSPPPPSRAPPRESSLHSRWSSKTIVVGPWVDVMTADATLFFFASAAVAAYPTYRNWAAVVEAQSVPMVVALSWAFVAFAAGVATVGIVEDWRIRSSVMSVAARQPQAMLLLPPDSVEFPTEPRMVQEEIMQEQKRNRHSVFLGALRFSSAKVKFQAAQVTQPVVKALLLGSKTWTSLSPTRPALQVWEVAADPTLDRHKNNVLMTRLLRNPVYKRVLKVEHLRSHLEQSRRDEAAATATEDQIDDLRQSSRSMGQFELPDADTLNEFVVLPMLKLRGMDVFMTDDPETEVATHPWLIEQGLRSVPTLVVNLLTPWANLLVYLEMPSWVTRLSDFDIEDDDEEDVKALKHFLNGDSTFRNLRLKMVPSVVDGPLAVRVLAPPKREICVSCALLPVSWRSYEAEIDAETGRKLAPALEVELDCTSNRAMRSMAGILKRNLQSLAIDVAVVIQKPEEKDDDEPQACLAMWRFNHIDVSKCPTFPDRFEYESQVRMAKETAGPMLDPDVVRASKIVLISNEELEVLAAIQ